MPMSILKEEDIFEKIISIKYDVANDELNKFDDYKIMIDQFYNRIMSKNA
jgi:V/A-type H+-transporting ATPase subunit A